ncbi:unnamed protein product [Rhizophagus irregularis]|nr:unnamed protein product [Rhizophagus irregularis]
MSYQNSNSHRSLYFYLFRGLGKRHHTVVTIISRKSSSRAKNISISASPGIQDGKDIFRTLYYECFVEESSELLVDDGSYPFPYLITHDEMNAFDVEWILNEDYSRVGGRDNVWCIIDGKPPRVNQDFDTV